VAWDKGEQINSIPDAIGTAMRRYLDGEIDKPYPKQQNLTELERAEAQAISGTETRDETDGGTRAEPGDADSLLEAGESPECPECGSMSLNYTEGCKTCEACGWSEC
jgi:ribonucleoside-diphosphate reductase alpha chain